MGFLVQLGRRNVIRMAGLYLVGAWLVTQVCSTVLPMFGAPEWLPRSIVILIAIGLVPALAFSWIYELTPEGLKREAEVEPSASIAPKTGRRMDRAIIVVLLLALGYFAFDKFLLAPRREATAVAAATTLGEGKATVPVVLDDKSIAVMPLANGGGEGQQFFSDGLSEALIIALSQFEGLKVIGRNSAFRFRDAKHDSAAIGRELGVAHLLEGSVQHAGDVVRISVELIDAASGQTRWSQRYDRPYKDLFKLQDEITSAVAAALEEKLQAGSALAHSDRPPSGSIEAYNAYLQGLKHWHDQEFPKAAGFMAKAVQLDPGYALAWAHLSGAWSTVAAFGNEAPVVAGEHMRQSRIAADEALRLAPGLGAAHAARAYLHFYNLDHRGALAECRRAVQLAPRDGTVLNGCGFVLGGIGKMAEAIRLRARLLSTEPLYTVNYLQYSLMLATTGRLDEAEKYLGTSEEVARPLPLAHLWLALLRGDADAALVIARQAPPRDRALFMTLATQIGPDRAAADRWLAARLADTAWVEWVDQDGGDDNRYRIAQIHALRGDAGQTLESLERALAENPSRAFFMLADPFILRFRDDPRFVDFCRKLGLPSPTESEALSIDQIRARVAADRLVPPVSGGVTDAIAIDLPGSQMDAAGDAALDGSPERGAHRAWGRRSGPTRARLNRPGSTRA